MVSFQLLCDILKITRWSLFWTLRLPEVSGGSVRFPRSGTRPSGLPCVYPDDDPAELAEIGREECRGWKRRRLGLIRR